MKRRIFFKTLVLFFSLSFVLAAGAKEKIKIACVGDSITAGSGIKNVQMDSYPSVLGEMLGAAYEVGNFGSSGRTLLKKGDNPYWNDGRFEQAKKFRPNIVILKLGTNDSKPQNWEHKAEFKDNLIEMIGEFQSLESSPEVWLCTPMIVVKTAWGIRNEIVRDEIIPIIKEVANEKNLKIIDFYSEFAGDSAMIPDGVHPNEEGAVKMAQTVYKSITGVDAPALERPRGTRSVIDGFKRLDFPFNGRNITCVFPEKQDEAKSWVWIVDSFEGLYDRDKKYLSEGKIIVWADTSIWWGSPSSMRWAFDFYGYLTANLDIAKKMRLEASGLGALFALGWAYDSTDKVSSVYLSEPVCDLSKFPDRANEKQLEEFFKKWRISREELDDPRVNLLNKLEKPLAAGISIEIDPESKSADTETLRAAIKKAKDEISKK